MSSLESAVRAVNNLDSLLALLREELAWPLPVEAAWEDVTFDWTAAELRVQEAHAARLHDGLVRQVRAFTPDQPWGVFLVEFAAGQVYRTALRQVLRGLVPSRRRDSHLPAWRHENLLFLCTTRDYDRFACVHFRGQEASRAVLARFEWERGDTHLRTLCEYNLPALRFPDDGGADPQSWLAQWQSAFDVEKVTRAFFAEYRQVFEQVEASIRGVPTGEPRRLYTQRLLNRLMFLYFIQKKGWLSFRGEANYLHALFQAAQEAKEDFLNDRLYWTFFHGLNTLREDPATHQLEALRERRGDVPFLNGGLFDLEDQHDERGAVHLPNDAFQLLLSLFGRYNFTVTESTPLDVEVAVDPEMLGKIFEELVTGRHETGSYYTPRPVVAFMCREALKHYLANAVGNGRRAVPSVGSAAASVPCEIATFVDEDDPTALRDPEAVLEALRQVRVCDPACGSGAYLLGMLHELFRLRAALFAARCLDPATAYQRKLDIIEHNLYGVDLDPFAVNIAKLRLWLTLAVEFAGETPPPLPNLDFKLEVGDSLTAPDPQAVPDLFRHVLVEHADRLADLKGQYLRAYDEQKRQLAAAIRSEEEALRETLRDSPAPEGALDWRVAFAEVFVHHSSLVTRHSSLSSGFDIILANPPYVRQELLGRDYKEQSLKPIFPKVYSGTADLYVYFFARTHQLLREGGVGCFISSNKWLRAGYGEKLRQHLLDDQAFHLVLDFGDQPVFQATAYPCIFLWQKQPRGDTPTTWAVVKDLQTCYDEGVREHVADIAQTVPAPQFGKGKPRLASPADAKRREKMEASGPRLGELVQGQIYRGIITGLNEAFIIDRVTRDRLIGEDPKSAEILKPLVAGNDLRRYELHFRETYLIWTYIGVLIKQYPAIFMHLKQFQAKAEKRWDKGKHWWELRACDYYDAFNGPKIIYPDISKEIRFAMDTEGYFSSNTTYFIANEDWYLLGVLNSSLMEWYFREISASIRGGYLRFFGQYMETLPIPDAPTAEREGVAQLAQEAQRLHTQRRQRVKQFLCDLGLSPARSSSRNPLEEPWKLTLDDFTRRARRLGTPDRDLFTSARDATAALTEQIERVEREIDERVAGLYGVDWDGVDRSS